MQERSKFVREIEILIYCLCTYIHTLILKSEYYSILGPWKEEFCLKIVMKFILFYRIVYLYIFLKMQI